MIYQKEKSMIYKKEKSMIYKKGGLATASPLKRERYSVDKCQQPGKSLCLISLFLNMIIYSHQSSWVKPE